MTNVLRKEHLNVRIHLTLLAVTAALLMPAIAYSQVNAQQPPAQQLARPAATATAPPRHHGVAVIDITFILDNYARLKADGDRFKGEVEAMGKQFKAQQDAIVKGAEKLKQYKPGSPEFKKLEETLAQQQSDLKVQASLKEKEFAERESKIYLAAYQEVCNLVKVYSERNGISLVLRFNGKPVDTNNRDAIRAELFKTVLYNDPAIDITDPILAELNRGAAAPPTANRPGPPAVRTR
jgi:Skp family chaperone for outer membrane proteins